MTSEELRRIFAAPEVIVIDLLGHALRSLRLALMAQHPLVDDELAAPDDPPVRRRARRLLRLADRLQRDLDSYRHAVRDVLRPADPEDLPF